MLVNPMTVCSFVCFDQADQSIILSWIFTSDVEFLPVSQNLVIVNTEDLIYSEELLDDHEDPNDVTYSPEMSDSSQTSSQAWSEQSSQHFNVSLLKLCDNHFVVYFLMSQLYKS